MVSLLEAETLGKPHFRRKGGIWSCRTVVGGLFRIGLGYTVEQAWGDWKRQKYLCGPMGAAVWLGDFHA